MDIDSSLLGMDPSLSLMGAKKFLGDHGFNHDLGSPETLAKFNKLVMTASKKGSYAGKSLKWGEGGAAALLRHKLIVSGKYGKHLDEVTPEDWSNISKIIRINYFHKLANKMEAHNARHL